MRAWAGGMQSFFTARPGLLRAALPAGVFALFWLFYYFNLRHLTPITMNVQDVIFGSDTQEIVDALLWPTFESDMRKHVLFSVTLSPLIHLFDQLPFVSILRGMRLVLAALAAMNVTGVFLFMDRAGIARLPALLFAGMYAVSFSTLVIYSIPETYAMSNLAIIAYLLILYPLRDRLDWRASLGLSALAGLAALYNTPLLSLVGVHTLLRLRQLKPGKWVLAGLGNLLVATLVLAGVNLLVFGTGIFSFWRGYASQWASPANLVNAHYIATVVENFFLFSIASPVRHLPFSLGWQDWSAYWQTPTGALLSLAVPAALAAGLAVTFGERKPFQLSVLAWVGVMTVFYTYFNPLEAMLYASQVLAPLVIVLAPAFERLPLHPRLKMGLLAVFVMVLAANNLPALYAGLPGA